MIELSYLCMLIALPWCSLQDLKSNSVRWEPLLLWLVGSLIWVYYKGLGSSLVFALLYCLLFSSYMHFADLLAICCCSMWFEVKGLLFFFLFTGLVSLFLHWIRKSRSIPLMPAIATGWTISHFLGFFSSLFFTSLLTLMNTVNRGSATLIDYCKKFVGH